MTPFLLYKDVIRYDQSVPLSASVQLPRLLPKVAKRPGGTDFTRGRGSSSDPEAAEASRAGTSARSPASDGRPAWLPSLKPPRAPAEPEGYSQSFLQKAAELRSTHKTVSS